MEMVFTPWASTGMMRSCSSARGCWSAAPNMRAMEGP